MRLKNDPDAEVDLVACSSATDSLIAQYFSDVRRYPLLSFPEEKALWHRITRCQNRVRRALYTSPTALPTLLRLWHQIEGEKLRFDRVFREVGTTAQEQAERRSQVAATLQDLRELGACLKRHTLRWRASDLPARQCQSCCHGGSGLWRQWLDRWETLALNSTVFETLRAALHLASRRQPDDQALRRAVTTLARADQQLKLAKAEMIQANLRLVIHVANRYRHRGAPFLDLIQEGNVGLMRALDKFEPQRGLKFVTYAHWLIRQAVSRALHEQHRTVRLPAHIVERRSKLQTTDDRLRCTYGRAPTVQELSDALEWTPQEVEELRTAMQPLTRLHQPITDDGSLVADVIKDEQAVKPEEWVAADQLRQRLEVCLAHLPEREAFIIRLRYGIRTDHTHTLQEIADLLGLTRERVRQLEKIALEKLRHPQQSKMLTEFVHVGSAALPSLSCDLGYASSLPPRQAKALSMHEGGGGDPATLTAGIEVAS